MIIIEGLKRLRLLEKRMDKNCLEIAKYSSLLSNEKPVFDTEEKQRAEVLALIDSNRDLEAEYCKLKAAIDYTNLTTDVTIEDQTRTIHGWLNVLRKTGAVMIKTYASLTEKSARSKYNTFSGRLAPGEAVPAVIRLYDENMKRNGQRLWEDLTSGKTIEGRLEVINATTELKDI